MTAGSLIGADPSLEQPYDCVARPATGRSWRGSAQSFGQGDEEWEKDE